MGLIALRSPLRVIALFSPLLLASPASADLVYAGLNHTELGEAVLTATPGSQILSVSNIGSSGLDGVEIHLPAPDGHRLNVYYQIPATDGTLNFTGVGSTGAGSEQEVGNTRIEYAGDTAAVSFDYSAIGSPTYTLRIYNGRQLVHESQGHPSGTASVVKSRFKFRRLPMDDVHMGWWEQVGELTLGGPAPEYIWHPGYTCDTMPGGQTNRVIGGPEVFGDLLIGIPENPSATVLAASRFKIQAGGQITDFQIGAESFSSDSVTPLPYSIWAHNVAAIGDITLAELGGPHDDYDHDGFSNQLEYAFGSDPLVSANGPVITSGQATFSLIGTTDEYLTLSGRRPADRMMPVAQASDNLLSWATAVLVSSVSQPDGRVLDTWRTPDPMHTKPRAMLRFQVTTAE